ncbi:site-specific recombination directionality factor RDF [Mycobacterium phage Jeffabunny]|uniref:Lipoprotein n=6 Tax=Gladiatorvirus TaxID=2948726 RepID=V5R4N1_9CAUD|nr:site-specific recombination directionality factor RDF [Mycobacterium phage CloudWang3]YP_008858492.1 site-specific recombination directionality factor RDF [Mycobacterium phage Artemis2UCLA]YP_008859175.1 site-specific recombination directionality factor RDF [Mycobacterium phage Zaka]YP_009635559.1 site-specific recombination directionality factor RDF [Mycobacterium phage Gladiator]YP_009636583.1 site-specific recombination directionality factor RDF [Mycobacterium phage Hammer]YP_009638239.1
MKKLIATAVAGAALAVGLVGCSSDADVASDNLSKAADNFEIPRRIVFFNGITDKYLLEIAGYCSIAPDTASQKLDVTCKKNGQFKKHFLGLSDNVSYFVEQIEGANVSTDFYEVNFKPQSILPDIELR